MNGKTIHDFQREEQSIQDLTDMVARHSPTLSLEQIKNEVRALSNTISVRGRGLDDVKASILSKKLAARMFGIGVELDADEREVVTFLVRHNVIGRTPECDCVTCEIYDRVKGDPEPPGDVGPASMQEAPGAAPGELPPGNAPNGRESGGEGVPGAPGISVTGLKISFGEDGEPTVTPIEFPSVSGRSEAIRKVVESIIDRAVERDEAPDGDWLAEQIALAEEEIFGDGRSRSVEQSLEDAKETFQSRNPEYGNSFEEFGSILQSFFPRGLTIVEPGDWGRFAVWFMAVGKLHRYANHMTTGGHEDSAKDAINYAAMLHYLTDPSKV